jgi:hypothetical protein
MNTSKVDVKEHHKFHKKRTTAAVIWDRQEEKRIGRNLPKADPFDTSPSKLQHSPNVKNRGSNSTERVDYARVGAEALSAMFCNE